MHWYVNNVACHGHSLWHMYIRPAALLLLVQLALKPSLSSPGILLPGPHPSFVPAGHALTCRSCSHPVGNVRGSRTEKQ